MANAHKEKKKGKSRKSQLKSIKRFKANQEVISKLMKEIQK